MTDKILNNKFLILFFLPFLLGSSTVFSFQPFNLFFINFIILPFFFLIIVYVKKNQKVYIEKNPIKKIYSPSVSFLDMAFISAEFTG